MKVGDLTIVALSDGTTVRNVNQLITKIPLTETTALMALGYRQSNIELSINAFLIDEATD